MKYINYIVILVMLITGCATRNNKSIVTHSNGIIKINDSIREKYEVINDFLDTKIKDRSERIIIMNQKINTDMTLRLLRVNHIYSVDSLSRKRIKEDKTFYKEEEWEKTRKKYSTKSIAEIESATSRGGECCWVAENFKYKNVTFEEFQIATVEFENKYMSSRNYDYYCFSEPIYYQRKEYLIFTFFDGTVFPTFNRSSNIIVYRKKNAKWVQTNIGDPDWFD